MQTSELNLHKPFCAENGFMGMGIGAAMTGLRPIIEGMNMGFLLLAYNQISNNAGMLHYTSGGQYKVCSCAYQQACSFSQAFCSLNMHLTNSNLLLIEIIHLRLPKWHRRFA